MAQAQLFSFSPDFVWWGRFFEPFDESLITTRTASTFAYKYDSGQFANWTVTAKGAGFAYLPSNPGGVLEPTAGDITSVEVRDGAGHLVVLINGYATAERPSLVDFFGASFDIGSEAGPSGGNVLAVLLNHNDTIIGSNNSDDVGAQLLGNNSISLGGGHDFVMPGAGTDSIDGGTGFDTISYQDTFYDFSAFRGIVVNVAAGTIQDPWGATDSFTNIEVIWGSRFADRFVGSTGQDTFQGLRGADTINGGGGDRDEARYDQDARWGGSRGIIVNLQTSVVSGHINGTIRDGFGQTDTVIDLERVVGTMKNDSFVGSSANNWFDGLGGVDTFNGSSGFDFVSFLQNEFHGASFGVSVNLATNKVSNDGYGNIETLASIEAVIGSGRADTIVGSSAGNYLEGRGGLDKLTGGGGSDNFGYYGGVGEFGDTIADFVSGTDNVEFGVSNFAGMDTTVRFNNGSSAAGAGSWFFFNAANDTLSWDRDGTGTTYSAVAVATLTGLAAMSSGDFVLL